MFRLLVLLLLSLTALSAQNSSAPKLQPRPAETSPPAVSGADRQITLEVQVTDKSGAPVRGLQKEDFTVLDDKRPQNILSLHAVDRAAGSPTDPPVEIVLVIDAVNAPFHAVTYERTELKKFLLQNGGALAQPVSLVIFSDTGTQIQNGSSRDGNALAAIYDQYQARLRSIGRAQGFNGAVERFNMSIKTLVQLVANEGKKPGRKLMIWFSPGWPTLSGPGVEITSKDEENFFHSIVTASNGLRQGHITLYSIDPLGLANAGGIRTSYYQEFLQGVSSPQRAMPGDLGLQVLAVQSGGRVFNSSNDITTEIAKCAADADASYVLSFDGARADQANEYHSIAITVDKPGITARTRTGYYAQP
jgi:VWFA-related protein